MYTLKIAELTKAFGNKSVFAAADMEVPAATWVYLNAPNGTGKTTLVDILCGYGQPDSGQIFWEEGEKKTPLQRPSPYLHMVFQAHAGSLDPRLSAGATLQEPLYGYDRDRRRQYLQRYYSGEFWQKLRDRLRIADRMLALKPARLSYGQQKRVALLRALLKYHLAREIHSRFPHVFLLDEVCEGNEKPLREEIYAIVRELRDHDNCSALWIDHANEELKRRCEVHYTIADYKIVRRGNEEITTLAMSS